MTWQLAYPWVLLLGSLIPLIWIIQVIVFSRKRGIISSVPSRVAAAGASARTLTAWIPSTVMSIALITFIIALARPQEIVGNSKTTRDAIALELVVDRSGSMEENVTFNGQRMNRLDAVKIVVEQFIVGDDQGFNGREGDLLGLIVFGSFADTLMPLTQSHEPLIEALRRIELPRIERERSTAIGDALMLAAARLKASEDSMRKEMGDPEFTLKSKAVVLLTDGENRAGTYSPQEAASLAKDWGIKVYIIGIRGGTTSNGLFFGRGTQEVNDQRMSNVAEYTGGQYWGVDKIGDLERVYAQIDELERSTIEVSESTSYIEWYMPFAIIGAASYIVSLLLRSVVYRSVL
jgi:Ca-activated chloride channel family protein